MLTPFNEVYPALTQVYAAWLDYKEGTLTSDELRALGQLVKLEPLVDELLKGATLSIN
jgi:hypothetical protein